jgi:hypothetical protein
MNKKWITIIGSGVLVIGLAGASFANSDEAEVRDGTIRIENQTEADFPTLAKITHNQAVQKAWALSTLDSVIIDSQPFFAQKARLLLVVALLVLCLPATRHNAAHPKFK